MDSTPRYIALEQDKNIFLLPNKAWSQKYCEGIIAWLIGVKNLSK